MGVTGEVLVGVLVTAFTALPNPMILFSSVDGIGEEIVIATSNNSVKRNFIFFDEFGAPTEKNF